MRSQRFTYTLPPQDDLPVTLDSEDASLISTHLTHLESPWHPMTTPEPGALIPYCVYQYPLFQFPAEPFAQFPHFYNSSLAPTSLASLETISHYNDELFDHAFTTESVNFSTPYGDGFTSDGFSAYGHSFTPETGDSAQEQQTPSTYPMITNYGAVTILLRHLVRIDISPAKAVYLTNHPATCFAAINGMGDKCSVIHPNGRVLYDGKDIHISTMGKRAKISKRGIVFTSSDHCLSYLVDASGTKTTAEKYRDLSKDFTLEVFYDDAMAQNDLHECYSMVDESHYKRYWNGDEVWFIGGFRIKQNEKGDVKVSRHGSRYAIRSSPTTGQISVKTFSSEITIGRYPNNYLVVRKGNKQVTASLWGFNVQNGTQKAGFNNSGRLALF